MYVPDILFEIKGVKIAAVGESTSIREKDAGIFKCEQYNTVLCFYTLCFSAIMRCSYWNSEKLNAISEFSASMNKEYFNTNKTITCNNILN